MDQFRLLKQLCRRALPSLFTYKYKCASSSICLASRACDRFHGRRIVARDGAVVRHDQASRSNFWHLQVVWRQWLVAACLFAGVTCAIAQTWTYQYDEVGQLRSAISTTGDRAIYEYDRVGNLKNIRRVSAGTLSISEFTPQIGVSGTSVTVLGSGFSTTLANNVVKFNGVNGTVTAATATQLTVTAPAATTGPLSVTVAGNTFTTADNFIYQSGFVNGPPTISSLSASCVAPGSTVTITGTNFDLTPGATRVEIGNNVLPATVASTTSATVTIASDTGTGRVRVVTPRGIATSAGYLLVNAYTWSCGPYAPIVSVMTPGGASQPLGFPLSAGENTNHAIVFEGNVGDLITAHFSVPTNGAPVYAVATWGPRNQYMLASGRPLNVNNIDNTHLTFHVPPLPQSGTYTLWVTGFNTSTTVRLVSDAVLPSNNTVLTVGPVPTGETRRYGLDGVTGQINAVKVYDVLVGGIPPDYQVFANAYRPDGTVFAYGQYHSNLSGALVQMPQFPFSGKYSVIVAPGYGLTNPPYTAKIKLDSNTAAGTAVTIDGPAVVGMAPLMGEHLRFTFNATAGQNLGIGLSDYSMTSATMSGSGLSPAYRAYLYRPDGFFVPVADYLRTFNLSPAPVTGMYSLVLNSEYPDATAMSAKAWVSTDTTGTVIPGTPATATVDRPGRNVRWTYAANAGDFVGINLVNSPTNSDSVVQTYLYRPDGSLLFSTGAWGANGSSVQILPRIPVTGNYTVVTEISDAVTGSTQITLRPSVNVTLTPDATPPTVTTTSPGQSVKASFSGTAGQNLGFAITDLVLDYYTYLNFTVYDPSGNVLVEGGGGGCAGDCSANLTNLPVTGTYVIRVVPGGVTGFSATSSMKLNLMTDQAGGLVSGTPLTATLSPVGKNATFTFAGVPGDQFGLALYDVVSTAGASIARMTLFAPDGTQIETVTAGEPNNGMTGLVTLIDVPRVTVAGTYRVRVEMEMGYSSPGSAKVLLTRDLNATLVLNGTPTNVSTTLLGQTIRSSFAGTAGQKISVALTGVSGTSASGQPWTFSVYGPDGATYGWQVCYENGVGCAIQFIGGDPGLPVAGTYEIVVSPPPDVAAGSATIWLSQDTTAALTVGQTTTVSLSRPGQVRRYTFAGVADTQQELTVTNVTATPSPATVDAKVLSPSGGYITSAQGSNGSNGSATVYLYETGTFTVVVGMYPGNYGAATGSASLRVGP